MKQKMIIIGLLLTFLPKKTNQMIFDFWRSEWAGDAWNNQKKGNDKATRCTETKRDKLCFVEMFKLFDG